MLQQVPEPPFALTLCFRVSLITALASQIKTYLVPARVLKYLPVLLNAASEGAKNVKLHVGMVSNALVKPVQRQMASAQRPACVAAQIFTGRLLDDAG